MAADYAAAPVPRTLSSFGRIGNPGAASRHHHHATKGGEMITDDEELMDEGRARPHDARRDPARADNLPPIPDEPAPVNKLQQVVRALVSKAARETWPRSRRSLDPHRRQDAGPAQAVPTGSRARKAGGEHP